MRTMTKVLTKARKIMATRGKWSGWWEGPAGEVHTQEQTMSDDPKVIEHNAQLHKTHAEVCASARRMELMLWKAIGRPRPKLGVRR
jgi:hypothetical protein